jgi:Transposase and inactivated derivatives
MSLRPREGHRVFVYSEYVDMRAGFERLSLLVREKMRHNILDGDLFVFLGRNRKRLKAIFFDGTGLILLTKRLERGSFMPLSLLEDFEINEEELNQLFSGSIIRRARFGNEALTLARGIRNFPWHAPLGARDGHQSSQGLCQGN